MVAIGSCIGSGIFVTPSQIAGLIPSPLLILAVWAIGGVITLTGALTFGELGSIAVLSLAFSYYLSFFIPMNDAWKIMTSIIVISVLTTLNVLRAKFGEMFSNIFTSLKILGILIIICVGLFYGKNEISFKGVGLGLSSSGNT